MGFWDFIAPDFASFKAVLDPIWPVTIGFGLNLTKEGMIEEAWASPGSAAGLAARLYYELAGQPGGNQATADRTWNAVRDQGQATQVNGRWVSTRGAEMTLVIDKVYRCNIDMVVGGRNISNVIGVRGAASGQEADVAAKVLTAWKVTNGPLSKLSNLIAMTKVLVVDLSTVNGGIAQVTDSTVGGNGSTPTLSTRAACTLVKLNGSSRNPRTRGRVYYGPLMEADINSDGATLASASATAHTAAFGNFKTSLSGNGYTWCVISRSDAAAYDITTVAAESTIATQRRRLRS